MAKLETKIGAGEFVITAEIVPPLSASGAKLLAEAKTLAGVDAINLTDAAAGKTSMSSFAAAAILAANGYEPILQVTCRDRNRIALAGDLIDASAVLPASAHSVPITYLGADGKQYVAVVAAGASAIDDPEADDAQVLIAYALP